MFFLRQNLLTLWEALLQDTPALVPGFVDYTSKEHCFKKAGLSFWGGCFCFSIEVRNSMDKKRVRIAVTAHLRGGFNKDLDE